MLDEGRGDIILYLIDMNGFKQINDTYGHLAGNDALLHMARVLSKQLEGFDGIVGRLGGDEFVAVMRNTPEGRGFTYKEKVVQAIGKQKFSNILKKSTALTEEEYASIRKYVVYGMNMTQHLSLSDIAMNCIRYHHERWDGAGYPAGAKGPNVSQAKVAGS